MTDQHPLPKHSTSGFIRFCVHLAAILMGLGGLFVTFLGSFLYLDIALWLSSEPVYEVSPEQVDPTYEGKYVKMRLTELRANGGAIEDKDFGIRRENCLVLCRRYLTPPGKLLHVTYHELDGVREATFPAAEVWAGAYKLRAYHYFWDDFGGSPVSADEIIIPAKWEQRVVERSAHDITLLTHDPSNLALPHVKLCFWQVPSPWQGERFVVGRQLGNELDLTGKYCGLIRGEEAYRACTRLHPGHELLGVSLGFIVLPVLCFFPGVLLIQKRGMIRAVCMALLLELLLISLMTAVWLLLPNSGAVFSTWVYTLSPALAAGVLLCFACRRRSTGA